MTEAESIHTVLEAIKPHDHGRRKIILEFCSNWAREEYLKKRQDELDKKTKTAKANKPS